MSNVDFLESVTKSFHAFLEKGTSRSTDKLKPLHGFIAADIAAKLGPDYQVFAQGYGEGKEKTIVGRYVDKLVDVTIKKGDRDLAGIAVKFVMQNYSQNSNNYFENMLGETANIRSANVPYFQVFIVFDKMPYYDKNGAVKHWETFSNHNAKKYVVLSKDNIEAFRHTPNKTLLCVVHLPEPTCEIKDRVSYMNYYRENLPDISFADDFDVCADAAVIVNDYTTFANKVYHAIMSL